jgi:hypothetical protein
VQGTSATSIKSMQLTYHDPIINCVTPMQHSSEYVTV